MAGKWITLHFKLYNETWKFSLLVDKDKLSKFANSRVTVNARFCFEMQFVLEDFSPSLAAEGRLTHANFSCCDENGYNGCLLSFFSDFYGFVGSQTVIVAEQGE